MQIPVLYRTVKFLEISPILTFIGQVVTGAALACSSFILVSVATSRTLTFVGVVCASLSSGLGRPLFQFLCFAMCFLPVLFLGIPDPQKFYNLICFSCCTFLSILVLRSRHVKNAIVNSSGQRIRKY
jgi:hypothetical protein